MRKIICLLAFITIAIMPMFAQETATKIKPVAETKDITSGGYAKLKLTFQIKLENYSFAEGIIHNYLEKAGLMHKIISTRNIPPTYVIEFYCASTATGDFYRGLLTYFQQEWEKKTGRVDGYKLI